MLAEPIHQTFADNHSYHIPQLHNDLDRFAFVLDGNGGDHYFSPARNEPSSFDTQLPGHVPERFSCALAPKRYWIRRGEKALSGLARS